MPDIQPAAAGEPPLVKNHLVLTSFAWFLPTLTAQRLRRN